MLVMVVGCSFLVICFWLRVVRGYYNRHTKGVEMTTELHFTKTINVPPETIFNLMIDLEHYNQWLDPSTLYRSVMKISENPIKLGSTYVDSRMQGSVTEFESARRLTFQQSQQM